MIQEQPELKAVYDTLYYDEEGGTGKRVELKLNALIRPLRLRSSGLLLIPGAHDTRQPGPEGHLALLMDASDKRVMLTLKGLIESYGDDLRNLIADPSAFAVEVPLPTYLPRAAATPYPGPDAIPGQRLLTELDPALTREQPQIVFTDLHGHVQALENGLQLYGYAEKDARRRWRPTEKALREKPAVRILGDANDGGPDFLAILDMAKDLKEGGMDLELLAGDHEGSLLDVISASDRDLFPLQDDEENKTKVRRIVRQARVNWMMTNGEVQTMVDIAKKYDELYGADFAPTAEEETWLRAKGYDHQAYTDDDTFDRCTDRYFRSAKMIPHMILKMRRLCAGDGPYASVLSELHAMLQQDDVLYVHGRLGNDWSDALREKGARGADDLFRARMAEPSGPFRLTHGEIESTETGQVSLRKPDALELLWGRPFYLSKGKHPLWLGKDDALSPQEQDALRSAGVRVIVRGHDPQPSGMQTVATIGTEDGGFQQIINADAGLKGAARDATGGHMCITTQGKVLVVPLAAR